MKIKFDERGYNSELGIYKSYYYASKEIKTVQYHTTEMDHQNYKIIWRYTIEKIKFKDKTYFYISTKKTRILENAAK